MRRIDDDADFSKFLKYAEMGDLAGFLSSLQDNPDVLEDMAAATRNTVLHVAAKNGHLDFITEILKIKPRLAKELDHNGLSPLHLACAGGHVSVVKALISHCPNLYMLKDCHNRIPLHSAVIEGEIAVILELRRLRETALHLAANGHSLITLHWAVSEGHIQAIDKWCQWSDHPENDGLEEVTDRGETALHLALTNNREAAFLALMDWLDPTTSEEKKSRMKKLLCDVRDKSGHTVLQLAISKRTTMKEAVQRIGMYIKITVNKPFSQRELVGSLELAVAWILLISELTVNREDFMKKPNMVQLGWFTFSAVSGTVVSSLIYRLLPKNFSKLSIYLFFMASAFSPVKRSKVLIKLALVVLAGISICPQLRPSWFSLALFARFEILAVSIHKFERTLLRRLRQFVGLF